MNTIKQAKKKEIYHVDHQHEVKEGPKLLKKILLLLQLSNDLAYFWGSVVFIVGSLMQDISKQLYYPTAICFEVGSALFLFGALAKLIRETISLGERFKKWVLLEKINFSATVGFVVGGILFTIGAGLFLHKSKPLDEASSYLWDVGASAFFYASFIRLFVEKANLTRMRLHGDNVPYQSFRKWLSVIGTDFYFIVGSGAFTVVNRPFTIMGNILWIIGSFCFIIGSSVKFISDIMTNEQDFDIRRWFGNRKADQVVLKVTEDS